MATLAFNTAIASLFSLNNHLSRVVTERGAAPLEVVVPLVLMVAPLAPHIAEELWERLGRTESLTYEPFPAADPQLLIDEQVEIPVQLNGKVRGHVMVAPDADADTTEAAARGDERVAALLEGKTVRKAVVVPGRLVNFVVQ
jgi:leucyl-tRNA synthetase